MGSLLFLHCALAKLWRSALSSVVSVCGGRVGLFVGGSVTTITRNCVHQSSPNWVCSDPLQLIKFWLSRAPGKGSTVGQN